MKICYCLSSTSDSLLCRGAGWDWGEGEMCTFLQWLESRGSWADHMTDIHIMVPKDVDSVMKQPLPSL